MVRTMLLLVFLVSSTASVFTQDTAASVLAAARKRVQEAAGRKGPELEAPLKAGLVLLESIPTRFPEDTASVAKAWLEMGRIHRRLGATGPAEAAFKKTLETPSEAGVAADALQDLASLYRRQKRREDAAAALQRIVDEFGAVPGERATALIRLAGLHRDAKAFDQAEACLRRCLAEHGDLWRSAVDALDDLAALKLRQKDVAGAKELLQSHGESIKARFAGTASEDRVEAALEKMSSRQKLESLSKSGDAGDGGAGRGS